MAIKEITDRLPEVEFDLITARQHRELANVEKIGNVTVYRLGLGNVILDKLIVPYWGAIKAVELNRGKHYVFFWCIMVSFASGAAYIANWFQKKVPIVLTLQEGDSEKWLRYRWLGLIDLSWRLALRRTSVLTAISNYLLERARRLGFKGEAVLIPNGVEVERFLYNRAAIFAQEKYTIITTSRLVEKNGVGDLIEAMSFLAQNFELKILGTGPLASDLMHLAKILKLESRVKFLGHVPFEEIPKHLHEADIFIRPSLSEGFGNSFIEAMAAGVPVIATSVGGIPDFLKDRETGLFCSVNNPKSIAEKVMEYVKNPELKAKIVANAQEMVKEKYDWNLIAGEMRDKVFQFS